MRSDTRTLQKSNRPATIDTVAEPAASGTDAGCRAGMPSPIVLHRPPSPPGTKRYVECEACGHLQRIPREANVGC